MTKTSESFKVEDHPDVVGPRPPGASWRRWYARGLVITDLAALIWAILGAWALNFVFEFGRASFPDWLPFDVGYSAISVALLILWLAMLAAVGSRGYRVVGTGSAEYKAVVLSALYILVVIALLDFLFQIELSRGYILIALIAGLVALLVTRALWRWWVRAQRQTGRFSSRVIIVGSVVAATEIAKDLKRNPEAGYWIVGACVSTGDAGRELPGTGIPVLGSVDGLQEAIEEMQADTVLVVGGHNLSPKKMRQLSWSLEPGRQHLVVAPSLTDIAGPRIHSRPVAGLPLIHVETPRFEGTDRIVKRAFDIVVSGGLLLVFSVPLLVVALVVATTSRGGVFFAHERIGKHGRPFHMLKFRSMVAGADARLAELLAEQGTSDQPLFKITNDPRITPIGGFIRRYSIDELPQLINVLRGDMSLVGPRPQVAREVELYDNAAARRLYVQPGMTGLWQVSGRSNLSWDEAVRLDLYYVENWSLVADLGILWRTARAVLASDGAV